jgi:acyl-homoserine lactone acylase PvdQ
VLFECGSAVRTGSQDAELFAHPWTSTIRSWTPRGLSDPARAAEAFAWAVRDTAQRYGRWDVSWGDVHRVRRGPSMFPSAVARRARLLSAC